MLDWGCNHSSGIVWIGEREREREEEEREKEEKESAWGEADCTSIVTSSPVGDSHDSLSEGGTHGSAHRLRVDVSESDGDGGSHGSAHRLRVGINAGASAEKVGVVCSLRCGGVGEGAGAGSAQSSFVGVAHETGTEAGAGVVS